MSGLIVDRALIGSPIPLPYLTALKSYCALEIGARTTSWDEDCVGPSPTDMMLGWTDTGAGNGSAVSMDSSKDQSKYPGVVKYTTGTQASGRRFLSQYLSGTLFGGGTHLWAFGFWIDALATGAQDYLFQIGAVNTADGLATKGLWAEYGGSGAPNWRLRAGNVAGITTRSVSATPVAVQKYSGVLACNGAGTLGQLYMGSTLENAVLIEDISTNIPTAAGDESGFAVGWKKIAGTTPIIGYWDMATYRAFLKAPR